MPATLRTNLAEIARELRPHVSRAVKDGAEDVAKTAAALAPVETGDLKRAIHVERRGVAEYAVVAGNKDVYYGHLVEFGSAIVSYSRTEANPAGRKRVGSVRTVHGRQAPRPFLVPALEMHRQAIISEVERALERARDRG